VWAVYIYFLAMAVFGSFGRKQIGKNFTF